MRDNELGRVSFDSAACFTAIQQFSVAIMNYLSDQLIQIFKEEISDNGNGSRTMISSTINEVHEISREVTNEWIESTVGIDEDKLRSKSIDTYVRVMTVLHGNNTSGEKLHSKPGQITFKKHILTHGPSTAKTVYKLPDGFNWPVDVSGYIVENAIKKINTAFKDAISKIAEFTSSDFLSSFVTVG